MYSENGVGCGCGCGCGYGVLYILNTVPIEEQVELIDTVHADWDIIGKLKGIGLKWLQ